MKLNTVFLFLLLILSIKTENLLDSFFIQVFKEKLKKNRLFQIIKSIKETYGQDVNIISYEELNKNNNGNCKKWVTEHMKNVKIFPIYYRRGPKPGEDKSECINRLNLYSVIKDIKI